MNPLGQIGNLLVETAFGFYILLVWLRFLLQLVHADFYNPISQFVVKATSPVLHPLRRIIPSLGGMDIAALVLIVLLFMLQMAITNLLSGITLPPLALLLLTIYGLLKAASVFYFWLLIVSVVLSWVTPGSSSPAVIIVYQLAEPVLAPCRRLLPAMGGIDLSPLIAFLGVKVFMILLDTTFSQVFHLLS